ncbi:MAG: hypothetical protein IKO61_11355 [Lachnospiraceae bacterium]|nr:hypothetical protein [Lachnospiraceae bacterium]
MAKNKSNSGSKQQNNQQKAQDKEVKNTEKKNTEEKNTEEKNTEEKNTEEKNTEEKNTVGTKKPAYQPQEAPKMTFYTIMGLISALVSVGAAFCSAIVSAMPIHYILETFLGESLGEFGVSAFESALKEQEATASVASTTITLTYVLAGLVVAAAILSIYTAIISINPDKKPNIIISIASFALLLGASVILPFLHSKGMSTISAMNPEGIQIYNVYFYLLIAVPAATVCALVNIFGALSGSNRYAKDGKAF